MPKRKRKSRYREKHSFQRLQPRTMLASFQLLVAGQTNDEVIEVLVDNELVQTIENVGGDADARQFESYFFETRNDSPSNVQVRFTNDGIVNGEDREVRVHSITIDGERFRTNELDVFFESESDDCHSGFIHSQLLSCSGYFEFQFDDDEPTVVEEPGVEDPGVEEPGDEEPGDDVLTIDGVIRTSDIDSQWSRFDFRTLDDPVIIAGPPTNVDDSPGVVQVRSVSDTSVDLRFKEWRYQDFVHGEETVSWLAISEGRYTTPDGSTWEVGKFDLGQLNQFKTVEFKAAFDNTPYLFLTVQTQNGAPVLVRAENIDLDSFDASLFEEQDFFGTGHVVESVGYLAIDPAAQSGVVNIGGVDLPYQLGREQIGTDPENIAGFAVQLQEEQSLDDETDHAPESVNAFSLSRRHFAQIVGVADIDPVALRQTPLLSSPLSLPPGFELEEVASDDAFALAVGVEIDAQGRQFVANVNGLIYEIVDGQRQDTPFLDIQQEVSNVNFGSGQLTGFTLDPDFVNNGYVYVLYTTTVDGESFGRLTRFTRSSSDPSIVDKTTARHLIGRTADTGFIATDFHSLGDLEFGEDGTLLVSWGDSASNSLDDPSHFNSQNLDVLAGKIFRINAATGRGFATNPFFDGDFSSNRSKVWAYGVRNGFRFTVQPGTGATDLRGNPGRILLADVGRDRFEELNVVERGDNLGWPYFEGPVTFRDGVPVDQTFVAPALAFAHPAARSVTGGVFIQGDNYPEQYRNKFLIADHVVGWIQAVEVHDDGSVEASTFATGIQGITDMFYDPNSGDVFIAGLGRGTIFADGEGLLGLYRLRYVGS